MPKYEHLKCPECGEDFKLTESYFKERKKKAKQGFIYCSVQCSAYARRKKKPVQTKEKP